ncbi:MAG: hypothetical protein GY826_32125 [Fuerstiella sp.]|nr:hypothetical protein [Fuerstiella sp.]MDG2130568.1 hypothetical protein [Fuerstiella sp.]
MILVAAQLRFSSVSHDKKRSLQLHPLSRIDFARLRVQNQRQTAAHKIHSTGCRAFKTLTKSDLTVNDFLVKRWPLSQILPSLRISFQDKHAGRDLPDVKTVRSNR